MIDRNKRDEVKKNIDGCIGQKVLLRGSLGRNKSFEKQGTLINTYPALFAVKMDDSQRDVTYTYNDVLTKTIELSIDQGGNFNSILNIMEQGQGNVTL